MDNSGEERELYRAEGRYTVLPRTLVFLRHGDDVLLLRRGAERRVWAGRYNGLGGHIERGEDVAAAARREVAEEAGITTIDDLRLRAAINVGAAPVGVLLFVFTGSVRSREVRGSPEGRPEWISLARLGEVPLVTEPPLLPEIFAADRLLYGWQGYDEEGRRLPVRFAPEAG